AGPGAGARDGGEPVPAPRRRRAAEAAGPDARVAVARAVGTAAREHGEGLGAPGGWGAGAAGPAARRDLAPLRADRARPRPRACRGRPWAPTGARPSGAGRPHR